MFKDEYKEAMEKIAPTPGQIYRVKAAMASEAAPRRRTRRRAPIFAAAALALCLAIFGGTLLVPHEGNHFTVRAYALGPQEDGSVEKQEFDLVQQRFLSGQRYEFDSGGLHEPMDGYLLQIGLTCEGTNIKSFRLVPQENTVSSRTEAAVNTFALTGSDEITDGGMLVLALGLQDEFAAGGPDLLTLQAVVTFNDGTTQEQTVTLDVAAMLGQTAMNP